MMDKLVNYILLHFLHLEFRFVSLELGWVAQRCFCPCSNSNVLPEKECSIGICQLKLSLIVARDKYIQ